MVYREAGQFKTSYQADVAIFPIRQDRIAVALIAVTAFIVIPLLATPYVFTGILIPFLILSLAAIGLASSAATFVRWRGRATRPVTKRQDREAPKRGSPRP